MMGQQVRGSGPAQDSITEYRVNWDTPWPLSIQTGLQAQIQMPETYMALRYARMGD